MRDRFTQLRAKELRHRLTEAEQHLWQYLRRRFVLGCRFRRQVPIGPYIADFACLNPRLVVEVDGSQHSAQSIYDAKRDAFLRARGYRVLRFHSNEVLAETDAVLAVIFRAIEEPPS